MYCIFLVPMFPKGLYWWREKRLILPMYEIVRTYSLCKVV